jgi:SAM-dependent methyltransferase
MCRRILPGGGRSWPGEDVPGRKPRPLGVARRDDGPSGGRTHLGCAPASNPKAYWRFRSRQIRAKISPVDRLLRATFRSEERHFWFQGFRRFVGPFLQQAVEGLPRPRVLDCGCGTGANLHLLEALGDAYGFDLTWTGVALAREAHRRRVVQGDVTRIPFPTASFDLVTSFDVLYCLDDEAERMAVSEMHRVLRPGGAIVVNTAAMPVLRGTHSVLSSEVRRYDRPRLRKALEAEGFRIERLTYTNASLFPMMLITRTVQRRLGLKGRGGVAADMRVPPAPVNTVLAALLRVESSVVRRVGMPFGSSLLCLARK